MSAESEVTLVLQNTHARAVDLCIEPWGECYVMAPQSLVRVIARGPAGGNLEVSCGDDRITVYAWAGSTLEVIADTGPLGPNQRPRVPD